MDDEAAVDLDAVQAELRRRVEERRARGDYPDGLAESLDDQWAALEAQREDGRWPGDDVEAAMAAVDEAGRFASERIELGGGPPARRRVHEVVARLVTRQVEGILAQARTHAGAVRAALAAQWSAVAVLEARQSRLEQRLETALDKLARYERGDGPPAVVVREVQAGLRELRRRVEPPAWPIDDWGAHRPALAGRFDAGPVLVVDGGPLDGVGPPAERADPAALGGRDGASAGGVLAGRVVERLAPAEVADLVAEAARVLRPGGRLVVDATNPASVYAMARRWPADPARARPWDHRALVALCRRAGFAQVAVEWHTPVPAAERPGGDGPVERLLFADQGYAVVATR